MTEFVAGRHQVLVCTTIIESGLDIPNCNTILIEGAGPVWSIPALPAARARGRFQASGLRLSAVAPPHPAHGYARGSASMPFATITSWAPDSASPCGTSNSAEPATCLVPSKAATSTGVGFELYCQLLRQSIARLKGDKSAAAIRAGLRLDFVFCRRRSPAADRRRYEDGYTAPAATPNSPRGMSAVQGAHPLRLHRTKRA